MTSISFNLINRVKHQLCQSQKWQYHLCGDKLCARHSLWFQFSKQRLFWKLTPGRASMGNRKTRKKFELQIIPLIQSHYRLCFDHYYFYFFLLSHSESLCSVKTTLHYIWSKPFCGSFFYSIAKDSNADLTVGNWNSKIDP